jgi:hypothetical protein
MRDRFAQEALAQIPKILTLQDRNPHSPHYGCFDRNYWQYKIIDFPSGMSQEFVWPLALVYALDLPNNPYFGQQAIRDWTIAGMEFAARSAHRDGSCDDYFPFERAGGAAAFSLLACLEAFGLLGLKVADYPELVAFFERRADWLAHHQESGQLTNHQALIVLCLEKLGRLVRSDRWEQGKLDRLDRVLAWQNPEGWFQEYEGCDPGYHSLTIGCLAEYLALRPDDRVQKALHRAIDLAQEFIHPDGSYGGEYASRNTYNFFPHGFERAGRDYPAALRITDQFLAGLAAGRGPCYADDHIVGHHTWSYLLAWQQFVRDRPAPLPRPQGRVWLANAQILIDRRGNDELYIALNKGGVFKLFRDRQLILSDTQFSLQVKQGGKLKNAVGHLVGDYGLNLEADRLTIQGQLGWAKQKQMTPLNLLILRVVMLSVGRFFPNLIRKLLQKMLITGKNPAPFQFVRQLQWIDGQLQVSDELKSDIWSQVRSIGISGHQTSIYVVMSRTYQVGQLQPWLDLTDRLAHLQPGQTLGLDRRV